MDQNPFDTPQPVKPSAGPTVEYLHDGSGRAYVKQIGWVAVLLILHAIALILFSIFVLGMSYFYANIDTIIPASEHAEMEKAFPTEMRTMTSGIMLAAGGVALVVAIFSLIAGILNFGYRARGFGIATLFLGISIVLTCYCSFTGLPISIYGLIIYFNPASKEAFRLRKTGLT
jgi:magnesium-transporting ATPase (P-type)